VAGPSGSGAVSDVPTVRLYFVSNVAGALEPCGCVKDQLGGLDHAAAWIASERVHAPTSALVAAGPTFFMNAVEDPDHLSQDTAKAEAMAGAMKGLGLSAWAPGANDWAAGSPELGKLVQMSGAPALAANASKDTTPALAPVNLVTLNGVRVALIGAVAAQAGAGGIKPGASPEDAVRTTAAQARKDGANVVIVLGAVGRGEAKRIADAAPDVTAIVVGDPSGTGEANVASPPGEQVGSVIIAETANHLQTVGVLDLFVRGGSYSFADATGMADSRKRADLGRRIDDLHVRIANWEKDKNIAPGDLEARRADLAKLEAQRAKLDVLPPPAEGSYFRYSVKEVRDSLGQDPAVKASMASYFKLVNETNKRELAGRLPPPVTAGQPSYVGIDACTTCHAPERKFWQTTRHASAYESLSSQSKEFNLDCVSCHVTGYDRPGGSSVTHVDKLMNVQCEVCHGPGSLHAATTSVKMPTPTPTPDLCVGCHHPPHVEGFDAMAKMAGIVGVGHGR
jgi:hypothetical protein